MTNNNSYFFILGKNPTLSCAEIIAVLSANNVDTKVEEYSDEVLLVSTSQKLNVKALQKRLGGTIKIGKIVARLLLAESQTDLYTNLSSKTLFTDFFPNDKRKIHFGLSLYLVDKESPIGKNSRKLLMDLSKYVKDEVKKTDHSVGFVQVKERFLSSVSVVKNELLTSGAEIVLVIGKNTLWLGKTESVQEFEEYSWRDFGRPERDPKRGMLPPKVAKMMINLAKSTPKNVLLDPFCGSGTVIQEAILLGFQQIIGSDISEIAVSQTQTNIDWLKKNITLNENVSIKLHTQDIRNLTNNIPKESIDLIITEPFLGPPLRGFVNQTKASEILASLMPLYRQTFIVFNTLLRPGGKVVIALPAFKVGNEVISTNMANEVKQMKFISKNLLPQTIPTNSWEYTPKGTILYGSPTHFLMREIMCLQKMVK